MIKEFTLLNYSNDTFEIEHSAMTGKMKITKNGLGLGIGCGLSAYNFSVFRGEDTEVMKYLKVIGVTILGFVLYLVLSGLIINAIG